MAAFVGYRNASLSLETEHSNKHAVLLADGLIRFLRAVLANEMNLKVALAIDEDAAERHWIETRGSILMIKQSLSSPGLQLVEAEIQRAPEHKRAEYIALRNRTFRRLDGYLHFIDHVIFGGPGDSLVPEIDESEVEPGPSAPFEW